MLLDHFKVSVTFCSLIFFTLRSHHEYERCGVLSLSVRAHPDTQRHQSITRELIHGGVKLQPTCADFFFKMFNSQYLQFLPLLIRENPIKTNKWYDSCKKIQFHFFQAFKIMTRN